MSVFAFNPLTRHLGLSTPIEAIRRARPKLTDLQNQAAPTPAGPCCTIGTVGDEVATSIENVANASNDASGQRTLYGFDGTHHDFPWVADGGISSTAGSGAVTGFSAYAAGVTVKASIEVIKEHGAREASARKIIHDLAMHQKIRQRLAQLLPNGIFSNGFSGLNIEQQKSLKQELSLQEKKAKVFIGLVRLSELYRSEGHAHQLDEYTYSLTANDHRLLKHVATVLNIRTENMSQFYALLTVPKSFIDWLRPIHNERYVLEQLKRIRDHHQIQLSDRKLSRVIQILKAYKPNIHQSMFANVRLRHQIRIAQFKQSMDWIKNDRQKPMPLMELNIRQLIELSKTSPQDEWSKKILSCFKGIDVSILETELKALNGISLNATYLQKHYEEAEWMVEHFIKPICQELDMLAQNQPNKSLTNLDDLFRAKTWLSHHSKQVYGTESELALKKFLEEGVLDSRSEKIIPGYLASSGISLLALGRFVPLATPVGQFILAAYAAGNLAMSARDLHKANQYLRVLNRHTHEVKCAEDDVVSVSSNYPTNIASSSLSDLNKSNHRDVTLQDAKEHYQKMRRWAIGGVVAWSINTLGMLTMGVINTMKWAVAFATAPLTGGISIAVGLGSDAVTGWMATGMIAATAAVGAAAFVGVPSNIKLRGRAYMSLKPPKSWEKEKIDNHRRDFITKPFTAAEIEQKVSVIRNERQLIKHYRAYFFENIQKSFSNQKAKWVITKDRWLARIVLWGTLGALSNTALALKFKNKVNAVKLLPLQQRTLRKQLETLDSIASVRNPNHQRSDLLQKTDDITFEEYVEYIKGLPIVGDVAKIFAKANTVVDQYATQESQDEAPFRLKLPVHKAQYHPDFIHWMGKGILNGEHGQEALELMDELNHFGPCCDTTCSGQALFDAINGMCKETHSKELVQRKLFQAVNQYLIYLHRKELKEERATWLDLYMKHLMRSDAQLQAS